MLPDLQEIDKGGLQELGKHHQEGIDVDSVTGEEQESIGGHCYEDAV